MKKFIITIYLLFFVSYTYSLDPNLIQVNHWPDGPCYVVEIVDNIAFIGNGASIDIVEITDINQLQFISKITTPGVVKNLKIIDKNVYVADFFNGLYIFSIEDINSPQKIGHYYTDKGYLHDVEIRKHYAYLALEDYGIKVIDLKSIDSPRVVCTYEDINADMFSLEIDGNYLYVADGFNGVKIFGITYPSSMVLMSEFKTKHIARDIIIKDNHAYIADYFNGLQIMDISKPSNPVKLGISINDSLFQESTMGVSVSGNYAYLANLNYGLSVIDIKDPQNPQKISSIDTDDFAYSLVADSQYVFLADRYNGMVIFDCNDPLNPNKIGEYHTSGDVEEIFVKNDIAFIAYGFSGLHIIDFSNPLKPIELTRIKFESNVTDIHVDSIYIYISHTNGFSIYDIQNIYQPIKISQIDIPQCMKFVINKNYLYLTCMYSGLKIYDISNIQKPIEISTFPINGWWYHDIEYANNIIFIAVEMRGLYIFDVNDPYHPELIETWEENFRFLYTKGDSTYLHFGYLYIIDSSSPDSLNISHIGDCRGTDFCIIDHLAYFAGQGTRIYDTTNDNNLIEIVYSPIPHYSNDIYVNDKYIYIDEKESGFYIYNKSLVSQIREQEKPLNFQVLSNYPNPFNATTTIAYKLSSQSNIEVNIYNSLGINVFSKNMGLQNIGNHKFKWNGTDNKNNAMSSGIYIIVLKINNRIEIQKMTLLK